ncbi:unnamed protein product [Closterium sp. Yama58-4]|nr:unnamed protein product [Closterium sp. Yama58-4]
MTRTLAILTLDVKNVAFSQPNDRWRKLRRLATLHLLYAKKLRESLPVREGEVRDMLNAIVADAAATDVTKTSEAADGAKYAATEANEGIELRKYLNRVTLNNIMHLTVGKRFSYSSIRGAAGVTPKAILEAAMKIDWNERIATRTGEMGSDSAAEGNCAAAAAEGNSSKLSSLTEEEEGELAFAIMEETFALVGPFNLTDYVLWLSYRDPQRIYVRIERLTPLLHGFLRACIEERRQLLKDSKNQSRIRDAPSPSRESAAEDLSAASGNADGSRKEGSDQKAPEAAFVDALFEIEGEGEDEMDKDEMLMLVTLEWALAELAQHPDMQERVRAEVDAAYARSASAEAETGAAEAGGTDFMVSLPVADMPYLQAVLKETLRHHTTAPILIPHMTSDSVTLGGYHIPPNTMIQINAWALAHDPTVWIKPHEFDPSRFLGPDAPDLTGQNFSLLTFGSGRRGCLGLNLGTDLSARLLANFIRRFQIELPEDVQAAGGVDMTEHFALTAMLAKPLRVVLRERKGVVGAVVADAGA